MGYELNSSTNSGMAFYGESDDATGRWPVIDGQGDGTNTWLFNVVNIPNDSFCEVDPNADLLCTGTSQFKNLRTRRLTASGQHVLAYAAESTSETLEDVGTGRMVGGVASVAFDRSFGSTIDRSAYHIFLTPKGDASFTARGAGRPATRLRRGSAETHGGRSTLNSSTTGIGPAAPIDAKVASTAARAPAPSALRERDPRCDALRAATKQKRKRQPKRAVRDSTGTDRQLPGRSLRYGRRRPTRPIAVY